MSGWDVGIVFCFLCSLSIFFKNILFGTRLAFDHAPMVSHVTLLQFCGRVECEKRGRLSCEKESHDLVNHISKYVESARQR